MKTTFLLIAAVFLFVLLRSIRAARLDQQRAREMLKYNFAGLKGTRPVRNEAGHTYWPDDAPSK